MDPVVLYLCGIIINKIKTVYCLYKPTIKYLQNLGPSSCCSLGALTTLFVNAGEGVGRVTGVCVR